MVISARTVEVMMVMLVLLTGIKVGIKVCQG